MGPSRRRLLIAIMAGMVHGILPILAQEPNLYEIVTVDQCYGQKIPVKCDPGFMVRVLRAHHRQTEKCKSSFHAENCTKEEMGNPACVGNTTCVFTTPWMYIDATCGYSNNFQVVYQCIPTNIQIDVCKTELLQGQTGYITTPNYPNKYPVGQQCTLQVEVHPLHHIRFYLLDLFLTYYNQKDEKQCIDQLLISDPVDSRHTENLCAGNERTVIFTTSTNRATITFDSEDNSARNAKGFWLYYEAFDPALEPVDTTTSLALLINPSPNTPTTLVNLLDHSNGYLNKMITPFPALDKGSTPWYLKYVKMSNYDTDINHKVPSVETPSVTESTPVVTSTTTTITPTKTTISVKTTTKKSSLIQEEILSSRNRTRLIHRIYGLVSEASNWAPRTASNLAPKTVSLGSTTTQATATGKGSGTPHPKISRGKNLKTKNYSRNLNEIDSDKITAHDAIANPISMGTENLTPSDGGKNSVSRDEAKLLATKTPTIIEALGKEYIAAIATGVGCLIILVGVICGIVVNNTLRKKKVIKPPKAPTTTQKPKKEVILAYDSSSKRPPPGVPNLGFQELNTPKEVNGFSNPHFKDGSTPWMQLSGLLPIDEIPENLYTEVKQCDLTPEHVKAKAQFILGRSKSKSMDDIRVKKPSQSRRVDRVPDIQLTTVNPMSWSLDSLDCGSQISCPSTVEVADEEEHGQEYYETIEDMYHDIALAHARATRQQFQERFDSLSLPSTPRSARSAGATLMTVQSPLTIPGMPHYIDTSYRANLLEHADVAL